MRLVGLTGGIASGKSTVSSELRHRGFPIIDCDAIAHGVVQQGRWGYRRVVAAFGPAILQKNGEIDRQALGALVFTDASARRRLNQATHLPVLLEMLRQLIVHWLCFYFIVVIDMPLLFETGAYRLTRPAVLVVCNPDVQLERLTKRDGITQEAAAARVAAQMPLQQKLDLAQLVINNNGSLKELKLQVEQVSRLLRQGADWRGWCFSPFAVLALLVLSVGAFSRATLGV